VTDWRSEVVDAVDEVMKRTPSSGAGEWRCLGQVTPAAAAGWYAIDLRTGNRKPPGADSFDQLCFADKRGPDQGAPIPIARTRLADDVLHVQVDGHLPPDSDYLWTIRMTPQHLNRKLRDGVAAMGDAPLADKLAAGRLDPVSTGADRAYPPGFLPAQRLAYRACTEPGLHAVWGPPGTGKTRVLARAIEDLVKAGKRVLLVSTANVAVDNALREVVRHLKPRPGDAIRVGPPQLPELAANDDVQLHRLAARATAQADDERRSVQDALSTFAAGDARLAELDALLAGYDHGVFQSAEKRVANSHRIAAMLVELRKAEADDVAAHEALTNATSELNAIRARLATVAPRWDQLTNARAMVEHLSAIDRAVENDRRRVTGLAVAAEHHPGGWLRQRRAARTLSDARVGLLNSEHHAANEHARVEPMIRAARAAAEPVDEAAWIELARRQPLAQQKVTTAGAQAADTDHRARAVREDRDNAERQGVATDDDLDLVSMSTRRGLPGKHRERTELLAAQRKGQRDKAQLEERLRTLTKRIAKLRKDAEGEIVAKARVVATTLARSRAHPAVAREQFDVVMVDEAGAAVMAEVLLAVSRATKTATLLGDFLQLGPVASEAEKIDKPVVRKWMVPDGFTHCRIRTADDVAENPGCVALTHQFRFGPNLRRMANDVVYGVLEDGVTKVSGRAPEDTEIVLVDVSNMDDLATVHRSSTYAGWWTVGALLSRALVEHHAVDGDVGVVTTFKQQTEATHAALKDSGNNLAVPVGTAHSFQGREFDTVVFDLVEDGRGWIAKSKWDGSDFERSGVRLFGVGITRARKRLYVIANGHPAVKTSIGGTPLGALRDRLRAGDAQWCRAGVLLGMAEQSTFQPKSSVEAELNEVLRGLVDVTDIHDEFSFDEALERHLGTAGAAVWMWSPWVGVKSKRFVPLIEDAVRRGVDVRIFVRTERDKIMRQEAHQRWVADLAATGAVVIRAEVEHRKIVVVDGQVVLLGSHNPLSQRHSREVMITCRGQAFAKRMLVELNAQAHGRPPACVRCGRDFELWRSTAKKRGMPYFWRCHPCKVDQDVVYPRQPQRQR
jgi:hypothetical protein